MAFVLDGSVTLAAILPDEQTQRAMELLLRGVNGRASAPAIWSLEVANALGNASRRIAEGVRLQTLSDLARLPVVVDAETAGLAWTETSRLADRHGLTTYDASYLELAIRLRHPLATMDNRLAAAARREAIEVL